MFNIEKLTPWSFLVSPLESTGPLAEDIGGLITTSLLSFYSLIGSAFTANENGQSFDEYINEVSTDMKGTLLGNHIAVNGDIDSYIAENCGCN